MARLTCYGIKVIVAHVTQTNYRELLTRLLEPGTCC